MRAFSIPSRAEISISSTARVRSISFWRTSRSEAIRASLIACSLAIRAFSIASRAEIWACSASVSRSGLDHRILFDFVAQLPGGLDVLHQLGQTLGVEPVRGIEEF